MKISALSGKKKQLDVILIIILFLFMSSMSAVSSAYGSEKGEDGSGTVEEDDLFILDKIVYPVEGKCNVFEVELKIHVEQEASATPCDVVLVMDSSGSMDEGEEPWPIQYAQAAARDFTEDILDANKANRVALVSYNSSASLKSGLSSDLSDIEDAIDNLGADGRTNMEDGFVKAMREIDANANNESNKAIVMLSDGVANQSGYNRCSIWPTASTECTDAALDAGTEAQESALIYTVGLFGGLNSEHQECLDIARETLQGAQNGGYFETLSAPDLAEIYKDIAGQIIYEIDSVDVTDTVSSHFELIPDSISDGGLLGTDNNINWSIHTGFASRDIYLTYQVKWVGNEPCGIYDVNDEAYLEYLDSEVDDVVRVDFPLDKDDVQVRCINAEINIESTDEGNIWSLDSGISAGTPPYSLEWSDNGVGGDFNDACAEVPEWTKPAGFYGTVTFDLTVVDANKCTVADSAELYILPDGVPGIDLVKTVSPDRQYRGKEVDYAITIENIGDIDLSGVQLNDVLLGLENYSIGDLPAGKKYIFTSSYEIPDDFSESYVENIASVKALAYTGDNQVIVEDSDQVRVDIRKKKPSGGGFIPHEPVVIPDEPDPLEPEIIPDKPEVIVVPEPEPLEPELALPQTGADYIIYNAAGLAFIAAGILIKRRKL